jgi:hypothetical protein
MDELYNSREWHMNSRTPNIAGTQSLYLFLDVRTCIYLYIYIYIYIPGVEEGGFPRALAMNGRKERNKGTTGEREKANK